MSKMNLSMITGVAISVKGKTYGTLVTGAVVFPKKDMIIKQGDWVIWNESLQTLDAELNPLETPIAVNVISSVWESKTKAIAALAETQLVDAEINAYVKHATLRIEKEFKLEELAETA